MNSIKLHYNGTIEDLNKLLDTSYRIFPKYSIYRKDLDIIDDKIINNFDEYKSYSHIYFNSMILINESINKNKYYLEFMNSSSNDKSLYSNNSLIFLIWILLIFVFITVFLMIYCYYEEIDVYKYVYSIF